jgi:ABC-type nitrate/sulfonate/bicarbonate transport system permease component
VLRSLETGVRDGTLPRAIATSGARLAVGYGAALCLGIPLGIGLARSRIV